MPGEWEYQRAQLKLRLAVKNVSQAAREIGVSVGYLHDLMNGTKKNPGEALRRRIARWLDQHPAPGDSVQASRDAVRPLVVQGADPIAHPLEVSSMDWSTLGRSAAHWAVYAYVGQLSAELLTGRTNNINAAIERIVKNADRESGGRETDIRGPGKSSGG